MTLPPANLGSWYDAGFGDGDGPNIGRSSIDQNGWWVPESVWVDDGLLRWPQYSPSTPGRYQAGGPDMLGRFVETWDDETGEGISAFASAFGVLMLCEHGLPIAHSASAWPEGGYDGCRPIGWPKAQYVALAAWRLWSGRAMALLSIAAKLQASELPDEELWEAHYAKPPWWHRGVGVERIIAADLINEWLALGGVRLDASWTATDPVPTARATGGGLFGAIALQLLLTTAKSDGLAVCSACGQPYAPTRKPPAGRDHYCPSCGRQAAQRQASRRYRAKKRTEKGDV